MTLLLKTMRPIEDPNRPRWKKNLVLPIPVGSVVKFVKTTIVAYTLDCIYHNSQKRMNIGPCRTITIEYEGKEIETGICMEDAVKYFIEFSF